MTINVREIVTQARERLADSEGRRWNDTRMLYLMNDALLDMSLRTRLLLTDGWSAVNSGKANYDLGSKVLKLDRIAYREPETNESSFRLPFYNHHQLDSSIINEDYIYDGYNASQYSSDISRLQSDGWDSDTSNKPRLVVVSKKQPGSFRLYPIPTFTNGTSTTPSQAEIDERQGIIANVPSLRSNPLDTQTILNPFGTVADGLPDRYLIITYIAKLTANTLDDTFEYDTQYRRPLENYIVAKAIREQKDTYDPERAGRETAYYEKSLSELTEQRASDFHTENTTAFVPRWYG